MIKKFDKFINESYYNSHGSWSTFAEIRELEVDERGNLPREEYDEWQEKYNIKDNDEAIWVTTNKKQAYAYMLPADYFEEVHNMNYRQIKRILRKEGYDDFDVVEISEKDGFIIPESEDGDNGFIFVRR